MTTIKALREIIDGQKITQRQLAREIGVTEAAMSRWLNECRDPKLGAVEKMAARLGYELRLAKKEDA